MIIFLQIILALLICALFIALLLLAKNEVTFVQHIRISDAIHSYHLDMLEHAQPGSDVNIDVEYADMEDYDRTLYRLWDWGYKRILPPDKYEIIKPYIN